MKKLLTWLLLVTLLLGATSAFAAEGTKSFSILVDDSGKAEDKIMYPILEEQTGIKVDLMLLPYEAAVERKNILINSGDYPDAIGGWLLSENDILTMGMQDGLFVPIDQYIDDSTPNMQKVLSIPGVRDAFTLPDGHIYTIPYVIGTPQVSFQPWINTEWLKNVGMEMPTTTEEFRKVLEAFRDQDANGNGDPNDEIPFSADPNNKNIGSMAGWFGVDATAYRGGATYFAMVDGKLQFSANQPGFKEFLKFFTGLYKDGLIDPELFTQDLETWKAKGKQNLYGCSMAYGSGDFYDMVPGTNETPFRTLPVLSSEYCDKPIYHRGSYGVYLFRSQVGITNKAADPGLIVKWFDNVFDLDNSMQMSNGLFGWRLEKLEDGSFRRLDEAKLSEADREKYGWANTFTQSLPRFCPVEIEILPVEGQPIPYDEKKTADAVYEPYLNEMVPQVWLGADVAERAATLTTDIANYIDQKVAEWVSGQADVEADWDAYTAKLEEMGLQEMITIWKGAIGEAE